MNEKTIEDIANLMEESKVTTSRGYKSLAKKIYNIVLEGVKEDAKKDNSPPQTVIGNRSNVQVFGKPDKSNVTGGKKRKLD